MKSSPSFLKKIILKSSSYNWNNHKGKHQRQPSTHPQLDTGSVRAFLHLLKNPRRGFTKNLSQEQTHSPSLQLPQAAGPVPKLWLVVSTAEYWAPCWCEAPENSYPNQIPKMRSSLLPSSRTFVPCQNETGSTRAREATGRGRREAVHISGYRG